MLDAWLPKGAPFFEYLLQQNKILCELCALVPRSITEGRVNEAEMNQDATRLEEEGDAVYTVLLKSLSQTFITPIDREDILRIGKEQENTIDLLHNLVARLFVFNISGWPNSLQAIAQNLNAMTILTYSMLETLAERKDTLNMQPFRHLRNECEMLISSGLGETLDVVEMTPEAVLVTLKLTRAYDRMQQALVQIVELAESVEEAVLKNV